jgi:hypothetical protein
MSEYFKAFAGMMVGAFIAGIIFSIFGSTEIGILFFGLAMWFIWKYYHDRQRSVMYGQMLHQYLQIHRELIRSFTFVNDELENIIEEKPDEFKDEMVEYFTNTATTIEGMIIELKKTEKVMEASFKKIGVYK